MEKMASPWHHCNWLAVLLRKSQNACQAHHVVEFTMNQSSGLIDWGWGEAFGCQPYEQVDLAGAGT